MTESVDVAVVGAGQAGLTTNHELMQVGVEHLVLERGTIGRSLPPVASHSRKMSAPANSGSFPDTAQ